MKSVIGLMKECFTSPWAVHPGVVNFLLSKTEGFSRSDNKEFESVSYYTGEHKGVSFANIDVRSTITRYDSWCWAGTDSIASLIKNLESKVQFLILSIDSPGGAADAVHILSDTIRNAKIPVLAFVDTSAHSAGYYIISSCTEIIAANPMAMIGSIGVMISFDDYSEAMKKEGVKHISIYAEDSFLKNKPYENMLSGDYELIIKNILNPLAEDFQNAVRQGRKGKLKEQDGVLNGADFFAKDALKLGLIDGIGNFEYALDRGVALAKNNKILKTIKF